MKNWQIILKLLSESSLLYLSTRKIVYEQKKKKKHVIVKLIRSKIQKYDPWRMAPLVTLLAYSNTYIIWKHFKSIKQKYWNLYMIGRKNPCLPWSYFVVFTVGRLISWSINVSIRYYEIAVNAHRARWFIDTCNVHIIFLSDLYSFPYFTDAGRVLQSMTTTILHPIGLAWKWVCYPWDSEQPNASHSISAV